MLQGTVFNIQKFSIHDGPGIRTTVFLKGCPLRCLWCHNPEGLSRETEIEFEPTKCIMCQACAVVCPNSCHSFTETDGHIFNRTHCSKCGQCVNTCVAKSLNFVGQLKTVDEVMKKVLDDRVFYETSHGGMTLSGGEPFFQADFSLALLKAAKEEKLDTSIETCGFTSKSTILESVPYVDRYLFDYKATGSELHKELTGVPQEPILENLYALNTAGASIILRCPIVPGANDTNKHFEAIASLAENLSGIYEIDLEPYHTLGTGKAMKIGKTQSFISTMPTKERMAEILNYISERTSKKVIIS